MAQKFTNMNKVGIVIVTYNNEQDIGDCLRDLEKSKVEDFSMEITVVDNNSSDTTVNVVKKFSKVKLLEPKENLGLSKANNWAIKEFLKNGDDYILIINPDTLISENLISDLVRTMQQNPNVGICGPKIYFAPGFEFYKDRYNKEDLGKVFWFAGGIIDWKNVLTSHFGVDEVDNGQYETLRDTDFVSGCAMFVRKSVFEKIGFLDEGMAMYLEDLDFCLRAKKAGFRIIYAPIKAVWHKNAQSSEVGSPTQDYYIARNRLLFAVKYAGMRAKFAIIRESFRLLKNGRPGQKQGVRDFYLKKTGIKK